MTFQPRQVLPSEALNSIQEAVDDLSAAMPSRPTSDEMDAAIAAALSDYATSAAVAASITAAIDALKGSVGSALDTLDEIAAALGDDANFAATMTTALAGKANVSHAHAADDITSGLLGTARLGTGTADSTTFLRGDGTWTAPAGSGVSTFNTRSGAVTLTSGDVTGALTFTPQDAAGYTAADVLAKLLTVDGAGSGLDADLLDGKNLDTATGFGANTVPLRDGFGYLNTNHLNITASDPGAVTPRWVATDNGSDDYFRWMTLANFKSALGMVADARLGTEASGTVIAGNTKAPTGNVLTGVTGTYDGATGLTIVSTVFYKPLQKQVGGSWSTVTG